MGLGVPGVARPDGILRSPRHARPGGNGQVKAPAVGHPRRTPSRTHCFGTLALNVPGAGTPPRSEGLGAGPFGAGRATGAAGVPPPAARQPTPDSMRAASAGARARARVVPGPALLCGGHASTRAPGPGGAPAAGDTQGPGGGPSARPCPGGVPPGRDGQSRPREHSPMVAQPQPCACRRSRAPAPPSLPCPPRALPTRRAAGSGEGPPRRTALPHHPVPGPGRPGRLPGSWSRVPWVDPPGHQATPTLARRAFQSLPT